MKKFLIAVLTLIVLLGGAAWAIPTFFKDDILKLVQEKIDEKLDANVSLNPDKFDLTLFSNFPNLTIQIGDLQVVGKNAFEGDTLANIAMLEVEANLKSVLFGDKIEVAGIRLDKPNLLVKVLADGKANYDIYKSDTTEVAEDEPEEDASFALSIDHWEISEGNIRYTDMTMPIDLNVRNLTHNGSGDITATNYDLETSTQIDALSVIFDGIGYLNKTKLDADLTLGIDAANSVYTFKESDVKLNDFALGIDGFVKMPADDIEMDVAFQSKQSSFKSLLSLIPAMFLEGFEELKAEGELVFDGSVKGIYNDTQIPGFLLNLMVKDGFFQYPDLPSAVKDVQIVAKVDGSDGNLNNLLVDISKFSMNLGNNPVSGNMTMRGLEEYNINADLNAKVDLAEMTQIYPIDSIEMKGIYTLNLKANGMYSEKRQSIPKIDASMKLEQGYINALAAPYPVEKLNVVAIAKNETGNMTDFKISIEDASMEMDGKPLTAKGHLYDLADIHYDFDLTGGLDLAAISKIYPIEGTTLKGLIDAEIHTKGKMSDIEAEKYDQLPTSGTVTVSDLAYTSTDLPQGLTIQSADMKFTPKEIVLSNYTGKLGKSDVKLSGKLSNYLAYVLKDEPLVGKLVLNSQVFDVNEWMVDESGVPVEQPTGDSGGGETTEEYGAVDVPKNIDFDFDATIAQVLYDKFTLDNMQGNVHVKDGKVSLNGVNFGMYGGKFSTNGSYDPTDLTKPKFDFGLNIKELPILKAYQNYASVKMLAPVAQHLQGNFGTGINISGVLGQDLMPDFTTLNGGGDVTITEATMQKLPVMEKLAQFTGVSDFSDSKILKDIKMKTEIKDGKVKVAPFDVKVAGYQANIAGTAGIDGSMDYTMKIDLPLSKLKFDWVKQYQQITGAETVPLNLKIGGNYNSPTVALDPSQGEAIKAQIKAKLDEQKQVVLDSAKNAGKGLVKDALGNLINGKDTTKTTSDSTKVKNPAEEAKNKLKKLLPIKKKDN